MALNLERRVSQSGFRFQRTELAKEQGHDNIRAHMWFNLAALKGYSVGVKSRDIVAKRMTSQQIAEAQKLARECQARNFKNCD